MGFLRSIVLTKSGPRQFLSDIQPFFPVLWTPYFAWGSNANDLLVPLQLSALSGTWHPQSHWLCCAASRSAARCIPHRVFFFLPAPNRGLLPHSSVLRCPFADLQVLFGKKKAKRSIWSYKEWHVAVSDPTLLCSQSWARASLMSWQQKRPIESWAVWFRSRARKSREVIVPPLAGTC